MHRTRLFWKLYITYLLAVVLCAGVVGWLAVGTASDLYHQQAFRDLKARAELVSSQVDPLLDRPVQLQELVKTFGTSADTRLTVIAGPDATVGVEGQVLADSEADPATMPNHDTPTRPEVQAALNGSTGEVARFSETLKMRMFYVAIPVFNGAHQVIAVIRTALPLSQVNHALNVMTRRIVVGTLLVALAVALLGLVVSRSISGRMREIKRGAERFAGGDFAHEIHVSTADEIGEVAVGLNAMGRQLSETIRTITEERNEREAVLAGMTEGVLAVDGQERIITINAAAARLLGVEPEQAQGRSIQEVVRNPELQVFVAAVLAGEEPVEGDVVVHAEQDQRELRVHGAQLKDGDGDAQGPRRGRRSERHHAHATLRSHQARLRGQRLARDQDAGHDDQGLRRDPARRRPGRSPRRREVPAHHRRPGRPPERHHRRPPEPLEPRERLRRRHDLARARQHPRRPAGGARRLRDEGQPPGTSRWRSPVRRISTPRSIRRCSSRRS